MSTASVEELIHAAQGNEGKLVAIFSSYTHNLDTSRELLQDLYVHALQLAGRTLQLHAPLAYLCVMARRIAIDWQRHSQVVKIDFVPDDTIYEAEDVMAPDALRIFEAEEELRILLKQVQRLPLRCRTVFVLKKVYGHTQAEIAEQLGITENTVEGLLVYAIRALARSRGTPVIAGQRRKLRGVSE